MSEEYERGYKQALIDMSIDACEPYEDIPVLIGHLGKPWGEKGYHTCEVGHPIYRTKLYDTLTYSKIENSFEKTANFPIGTFDKTMIKLWTD